jgi:hypothetical protein
VPFPLWPAFPTAEYYGTTDAAQVSLPDLLDSVSGQPPTFMAMDSAKEFRWRLSVNPSALRGSRPGMEYFRFIHPNLSGRHMLTTDLGDAWYIRLTMHSGRRLAEDFSSP